MSSSSIQDDESRLVARTRAIDEAAGRIGQLAALKEKSASRDRTADTWFRVITAILAVASPALVTYSTTVGVADWAKLSAIVLTAVAGASATLQAVFAFQHSYVQDALDALDLREVNAQLDADKNIALKMADPYDRISALDQALATATRRQKEITVFQLRERIVRTNPA